jgi:hypothetical protein
MFRAGTQDLSVSAARRREDGRHSSHPRSSLDPLNRRAVRVLAVAYYSGIKVKVTMERVKEEKAVSAVQLGDPY